MSEAAFSHYKVLVRHASTNAVLRTVEPVVERRFTYEYEWNVADHGGTPARAFKIELLRVDELGNESLPEIIEVNNPAPAAPGNLNLKEGFNAFRVKPVVPAGRDIAGLRVWVSTVPGFTPDLSTLRYDGPNYEASIDVAEGGTYYVRAAFFDTFGKSDLNLSTQQSITITLSAATPVDDVPPGEPTNLSLDAAFATIVAEWENPLDNDLAYTEVWVGATNQLANAKLQASPVAPANSAVITGLPPNTTRFVWVRAVDFAGNKSGFTGPQSVATRRLVADEIGDQIINASKLAEQAVTEGKIALTAVGEQHLQNLAVTAQKVADNAITLQKLASGSVNLTKFASGLTAVEIVSALPTTGNFEGRTVFLTTDGKLYRRVGSNWTAAVQASDISGQVQAAQIAALEAGKITGQLTSAQISSLEAAKLTGQITGVQISDNAVTAEKISAGSVTTAKLATGAVTADKIQANSITAAQIAAATITGAQIAAATILAGNIASAAITADKIQTNAVTSDKILANSITSAKIAAGAVTAAELSAGAVTTDALAIGRSANFLAGTDFTAGLDDWRSDSGQVSLSVQPFDSATMEGFLAATTASAPSSTRWIYPTVTNTNTNRQIPVVPGQRYEFSGYFSSTDARVTVLSVIWRDAAGATVSSPNVSSSATPVFVDGHLENFSRLGGFVTAPAGAAFAVPRVRTVTSSIGATIGSALYVRRLFFGEAAPNQTELSPWSPGVQVLISNGHVAARSISGDRLLVNSITASEIAAATITATELATNSVTSDKIVANSVTTAKIAANAVTVNELAANSVTSEKIAANSVVAAKIATNAVTADKIAAGSITTDKLAAGSITAAKIAAGTLTGQLINLSTAINVGSGALIGGTSFHDRAALLGEGSNNNPVRIHAGHISPTQSPFQVDREGRVTARRLTIYTPDGASVWFDTQSGFSELARAQIIAQTNPRSQTLNGTANSNSGVLPFTLIENKTVTGRVRVNKQTLIVTQTWAHGSPEPADAFASNATITLVLRTRPQGGSLTTRVTKTYTRVASNPSATQFTVSKVVQEPIFVAEPEVGWFYYADGFKTENVSIPDEIFAEFSASFTGEAAGATYELLAELSSSAPLLNISNRIRTLELVAPGKDFVLDLQATQGSGNAETLQGYAPIDFWRKLEIDPVPTLREIVAGNGLTGGGSLTTNRTLTLGTPSTIGSGSTNSVTTSSHTHALNLNAADIPNLDASKITSGVLNIARFSQAMSRGFIAASHTMDTFPNGVTVGRTDADAGYPLLYAGLLSAKDDVNRQFQLIGGDTELYWRRGHSSLWSPWRRVWNDANFNPATKLDTNGNGSGLTSLNASQLTSGTLPDGRFSGSYTGMVNLTGTGTVDFNYFRGNASDTAAAPSFSWTADTNTGMFRVGADAVGISTGGTQRIQVDSVGLHINNGIIQHNSSDSRDKIRVYSSGSYAIGMQSGHTLGSLNDWAMTFQMNNNSNRGFWWGHDAHTTSQGAMSLTTGGILYVTSNITSGGNITQNSDRNLKHSIRPWETDFGALIDQLTISRFGWNDQKRLQDDFGVIAQEVEELFPELITRQTNGMLSVDYGKLSVIAIGALKQERKRYADLESRVDRLEKMLEAA